MRWRKLGRIFVPGDHKLVRGCLEFAQSPQALVLEDRVRIYFSTRERDKSGKFLSHVAYADFAKTLESVIAVSDHTVIGLGGLGAFDEHGIFPVNVVRHGDKIYAYTTGWNRKVSVSADAAIGLAISADGGVTFRKHGDGPILGASLHEPFLVGDAFVIPSDPIWHMWYIHGTKWLRSTSGGPDRVYKIAHATSLDGLTWWREGRRIIPDRLDADECQALPTVVHHDGIYHMYFCFRRAHGFRTDRNAAYRLGYAHSTDLVHWVRDDALAGIDVSASGWDSEMQCYPNLFRCDGRIYLLYNGNEFGRTGFGAAVLDG